MFEDNWKQDVIQLKNNKKNRKNNDKNKICIGHRYNRTATTKIYLFIFLIKKIYINIKRD